MKWDTFDILNTEHKFFLMGSLWFQLLFDVQTD